MDHIKVNPDLFLLEEESVSKINFLYKASSKQPDRYDFDQRWVRQSNGIVESCSEHGLDINKVAKEIVDIAWNIEKQIKVLSDLLSPNDIEYYKLNKT